MTSASSELDPHDKFQGLAPFLRLNLAGVDLLPIGQNIFQALEHEPDNADLLMNASMLMQIFGNNEVGVQLQQQALLLQREYFIPAAIQPAICRLLVIMAPGIISYNTPIDCLLEGTNVELVFYYLDESGQFPDTWPEHDVMLMGVGEAVQLEPILQSLIPIVENWPKPVINLPQNALKVERMRASQALSDAPGVLMPPTILAKQMDLLMVAGGHTTVDKAFPGCDFPLIVRPRYSFGGQELEKITAPEELNDYLQRVPEEEFYVSNFIDYSNEQQQYCKLRVVLIDGAAYIAHAAISDHWVVHYVSAGMVEDAEKKHYEQDLMDHFDEFVTRHKAAFDAISERIGLDYLGMDCAETRDGQLLIFEVDPVSVVHGMDDPKTFAYKLPHIQKIKDAFIQLLQEKMTSSH